MTISFVLSFALFCDLIFEILGGVLRLDIVCFIALLPLCLHCGARERIENWVWGNIGCNLFGCLLALGALQFYVHSAQMCNNMAKGTKPGGGANETNSSSMASNASNASGGNGTGVSVCGTNQANYFSFMAVLTLAILFGHLWSTAASYNMLVHIHNLVTVPLGAMGVHNDFAPMSYSTSPADTPTPPADPYGAGPLTMTAQQQQQQKQEDDWAEQQLAQAEAAQQQANAREQKRKDASAKKKKNAASQKKTAGQDSPSSLNAGPGVEIEM